jgi:alpha,alpha-trehalase
MKQLALFLLLATALVACRNEPKAPTTYTETQQDLPPNERWAGLFEAVQLGGVFPDGKTFVDCEPKFPTDQIMAAYRAAKADPAFDLRAFVLENFDLPPDYGADFDPDMDNDISQHISALWPILTRQPDEPSTGSLLRLPHPYIVPGGRFREVYYWDSYFTMLGLQVDGQVDLIENMVKNFAHLIDQVGFIPNGNRSYYLTRSQPPFFPCMVQLLADIRDSSVYATYLPQLRKEYDFWMAGSAQANAQTPDVQHVVFLGEGQILNRYYDKGDYPRAESYKEDVETAKASGQDPKTIYRHLRSGAESGWDFSSRWLADGQNLATIHTTDIIPVDLNALLYNMERVLAQAYTIAGDAANATDFAAKADARKAALDAYCWDAEEGFYRDYDFKARAFTPVLSMAAAYPLFFEMSTPQQAVQVAKLLDMRFLRDGGFTSTLRQTGQQWDEPNGWAPLQWMAYRGLKNYGHDALAHTARDRWIANNIRVYENTAKMVEKYNINDMTLEAGGGEYPVQDGFGWSNGVLQRMLLDAQEK